MKTDEVRATLSELIEGCNSNAQALRSAGQQAKSQELRKLLERRAEECAEAANKLRLELDRTDGHPPTGEGRSDLEILEQCEHSENRTKKNYENALSRELPEPIKEVVRKQHEGVLRNHGQIKALRDRMRSSA
ncbi:DUF2383 domain-containing protein [Methylibium sp.]|uniref:DUF2383 domain-containing protein n=1 Tax=Methylibium sp. TaxID=2067992 RepID=UPI0018309AD7|nr:DUF2383 domain-containing protein [Methylibium sp.]MBA3588430.1 DUF2383 domain-containing protein [Methylibium sp.]